MGDPFGFEVAMERQRELLREAEGRRISSALRRARRGAERGQRGEKAGGVEVRWGLDGDEPAVAELLELNGMPRWISFEERFVVARENGKMLGAVGYRTESKRLLLGLLVVDPWAGEGRIAQELYCGAGELAREMGAREVVIPSSKAGDPGRAGYRRRGRGWHLEVSGPSGADGRHGPLHAASSG